MKTGIFGGTFSPIHKGHLIIARRFLTQLSLDRLFVVPDNIPPHKPEEREVLPEDRLQMTRLAFSDCDGRITVSDAELLRGGKSYTIDTLRHFEGEGMLFLLCGEDMIMSFETWRDFEEIFRRCKIVCAPRNAAPRAELEEKLRRLKSEYGADIIVLDGEPYPVSSTDIRGLIKRGEDVSPYVPAKVIKLIKEKGLYI